MAIIPEFSIHNDGFGHVNIRFGWQAEKQLHPLFPIINEHLYQYYAYDSLTEDTMTSLRIRLHNFLGDLVERNYLFKFPNKVWRINIVEYIANQLGASVRGGELTCTTHGAIYGVWGVNKSIYADCLVDENGELIEQMKMQPGDVIEWFAETIDDPKLNAAVEKIKNELILQVAHIE